MRRHFGLDGRGETLAEIAHDVGMSPAKTRTIKDRALFQLALALRPTSVAARSRAPVRRLTTTVLQLGPVVAVLASKVASIFQDGDASPPV